MGICVCVSVTSVVSVPTVTPQNPEFRIHNSESRLLQSPWLERAKEAASESRIQNPECGVHPPPSKRAGRLGKRVFSCCEQRGALRSEWSSSTPGCPRSDERCHCRRIGVRSTRVQRWRLRTLLLVGAEKIVHCDHIGACTRKRPSSIGQGPRQSPSACAHPSCAKRQGKEKEGNGRGGPAVYAHLWHHSSRQP